jgi:hypothetical protein
VREAEKAADLPEATWQLTPSARVDLFRKCGEALSQHAAG